MKKVKLDMKVHASLASECFSATSVLALISLLLGIIITAPALAITVDKNITAAEGEIWDNVSEAYVIPADTTINVASTSSLEIKPGVSVQFGQNSKLIILGSLVAIGTADSPIVFAPDNNTTNWNGIEFGASVQDAVYDANGNYQSGSILRYANISGVGTTPKGAIVLKSAYPGLSYLTVQSNQTTGIYFDRPITDEAKELVIRDSVINNNSTSLKLYSPGITVYAGDQTTIKILSTRFSNNNDTGYSDTLESFAATALGGGIFIDGGFSIELADNIFTSNSADCGGAIYTENAAVPANQNTLLTRNTISDNKAKNGGGICLNSTNIDVQNNKIIANHTLQQGAGYYIANSIALVSGNIFLKNQAINTGGAGFLNGATSNLVFEKNVAYLNSSLTQHGGVIDVHAGTSTIRDNSFTGNTAFEYGDVANLIGAGGSFSNNSIQGIGSGALISIGISSGENYNIVGNTFAGNSNISMLVRVDESIGVSINDNNFIQNNFNSTKLIFIMNNDNSLPTDVDATMNWWGYTQSLTDLTASVTTTAGVDVSNHLTGINTDAPLSQPIGLFASKEASGIKMNWTANPEADVAGYLVHWDTVPIDENTDLRYTQSADAGLTTVYTIPGNKLQGGNDYYIAVTAYDNGWNAANDLDTTLVNENLTAGNESWFSEETSVNWSNEDAAKAGGGGGGGGGGSSDLWWLTCLMLWIMRYRQRSRTSWCHSTIPS